MQYISLSKKTRLVLLFLFLLFILYILATMISRNERLKITSKDYVDAIALLNEKLPIQLDSETRLQSVKLRENNIEYTYVLFKKQKVEIKSAQLQEAFRKEILKTYCSNSDLMITFRESGYTAKYIYLDNASQEIFSTEITPQECMSR